VATPYYQDDAVTLYAGNCLDVLPTLPDCSVDAVVTDPPAGISFMGRDWDHHRGGRAQWAGWLADVMQEAYRVAKPGAHALVWALPRTSHWTAIGIEDAGWEIRDRITHLFGTGFPKSLDVSKAIDRQRIEDLEPAATVARSVVAAMEASGTTRADINRHFGFSTEGSGAAQQWTTTRTDRTIKPRVPTWEQWVRLRALLRLDDPKLDAEVGRLNGRKGEGSDAWQSRPDADYASRPGVAESWTDGTGWTGSASKGGAPATADAQRWSGWGTALKPAAEDWWLARKPLRGTVAANVLRFGTGALNIDACRIESPVPVQTRGSAGMGYGGSKDSYQAGEGRIYGTAGRWPANVTLDETAAAALDRMSGEQRDGVATNRNRDSEQLSSEMGWGHRKQSEDVGYGAGGGASRFFLVAQPDRSNPYTEPAEHAGDCHYEDEPCSDWCAWEGGRFPEQWRTPLPIDSLAERFFYTAKAGSDERVTYTKPGSGNGRVTGLGGKVRQCNVCETRAIESGAGEPSCGHGDYRWAEPTTSKADVVSHPTVKPLALMRWLVRLVTPPGGLILEPFAGSGTTIEAALIEGFRCIAIEREADYLPLILKRIRKDIQGVIDWGAS
jgi:hypothetical protein